MSEKAGPDFAGVSLLPEKCVPKGTEFLVRRDTDRGDWRNNLSLLPEKCVPKGAEFLVRRDTDRRDWRDNLSLLPEKCVPKGTEFFVIRDTDRRLEEEGSSIMRKKEREVTDLQEILEIMKGCDVCRLGLNDEDGYPYVVPLNFGLEVQDGKIRLYFHGATEGHKLDLIRRDDRAFFEMDRKHELQYVAEKEYCTMNYESVMGRGRVKILDEEEKLHALMTLMKNYHGGKDVPFSKAALPRTTVFALEVEEITGKRKEAKKF